MQQTFDQKRACAVGCIMINRLGGFDQAYAKWMTKEATVESVIPELSNYLWLVTTTNDFLVIDHYDMDTEELLNRIEEEAWGKISPYF